MTNINNTISTEIRTIRGLVIILYKEFAELYEKMMGREGK